jgi:hypothetical protein
MCKKKSKKKKSTCHRCGKKTFRIFEEYEVVNKFDFHARLFCFRCMCIVRKNNKKLLSDLTNDVEACE